MDCGISSLGWACLCLGAGPVGASAPRTCHLGRPALGASQRRVCVCRGPLAVVSFSPYRIKTGSAFKAAARFYVGAQTVTADTRAGRTARNAAKKLLPPDKPDAGRNEPLPPPKRLLPMWFRRDRYQASNLYFGVSHGSGRYKEPSSPFVYISYNQFTAPEWRGTGPVRHEWCSTEHINGLDQNTQQAQRGLQRLSVGVFPPRCQFQPGVSSTQQWTYACDSIFFQKECRTGTRGFVRSSAEENDIAIARNLLVTRSEFA
jgi:hypothetical protein